MVLKGGGDDVGLALELAKGGGRADGLVVRLAAPGGENHLGGLAAQPGGNASAGLGEGLLGPLAHGVEAGGVAVLALEVGEHGLQRRVTQASGGGVISVNLHGRIPFLSLYSVNMGVDRYRSPVSGRRTTMVLPSFSGRLATWMAAWSAAPEEMPTSTPSLRPMSRPPA